MTNIPIRIPADEPAPAEPQDIFYGLSFSVDQILIIINGLNEKARELKGSLDHRTPVSMKMAASDIAIYAGPLLNLSSHLASVLTVHVNRRPRP